IELGPRHGTTRTRLVLDDKSMAGEFFETGLLQPCGDVRFASSIERNDVGNVLCRPISRDGGADQGAGGCNRCRNSTEFTCDHLLEFLLGTGFLQASAVLRLPISRCQGG